MKRDLLDRRVAAIRTRLTRLLRIWRPGMVRFTGFIPVAVIMRL